MDSRPFPILDQAEEPMLVARLGNEYLDPDYIRVSWKLVPYLY